MGKRNKKVIKVVLAIALIVVIGGGFVAFKFYKGFLAPNVTDEEEYLYIYSDWDFEDIMANIGQMRIVRDTASFRWAAEKMDYPHRVKAGRYKLEQGMNNRTLINKLGGGFQDPVQLRFENVRLKENFAALLAEQLEPDSAAFISLFNDDSVAAKYGFNTENFFSMFIPNTYEVYWNTAAADFIDRMATEYEKFWNEERRQKAAKLNLTPQEVSILAAIVKGEALHVAEMPAIAGLYINRLRRGMLLQADPTVIF